MEIRERFARIWGMSFGEGDVFSFFYLPSLLPPPSPPRFQPKVGAILYTVQWDTFPRPLQISECRQPCDLFSVHSSRLLAAPQQAQGPFQSCWLVGFRLDAVSLYRFILRHFASLSLPLCPTTSSSTSPLSLSRSLSLPFLGVVPPPSPYNRK